MGWVTFVRERFQLPALLVLACAQAASAQYVIAPPGLDLAALAVAAIGVTAVLALLRLMDELKDLDKDRVAHPGRPLPRGVLSEPEARRGLWWFVTALVVASAGVASLSDPLAGLLLGVCVAYALLMYREFFAGRAWAGRPFLYAATHQVIVLPLYAFATASAAPELALSEPVLWFGLTGLGASFAFEVCRKLDPDAHPALGTYLTVRGRDPTVAAVAGAVALAALAAYRIDVHPFVWPAGALLLASLPVVYVRPERFAWVESAAGLFALVQVLAPTLGHVTGITE